MKGFANWAYNASWFTLGIAVASILLFGIVAVQAATTISTNISTGGTLDVTGQTTLTTASTSQITASGNVWFNGFATTTAASGNFATQGTLTVAGISTLAGLVSSASSTFTGALQASSTLQASGATTLFGTLAVTGASTLTGDVTMSGGSGALTLTSTNAATSTAVMGCIQTYATSTDSTIKILLGSIGSGATSTNIFGAGTIQGAVGWGFGTCP